MAPAYVRDCLCCESMPPAEHDPCQCESKGPPVQMQFPEVCAFLMRNVSFFIAITSIFNAQGRIASLPLFVCIKRFCSELSRNF
eukprot:49152-Pelagomonas_calceolata.AAC.1